MKILSRKAAPLFLILCALQLMQTISFAQNQEVFNDKRGNKIYTIIDPRRKTVSTILGLRENISDYGFTKQTLNTKNVEIVANKFLTDYSLITKININNIIKREILSPSGCWIVKYQQIYNGVPVDRSGIMITVVSSGDIISFDARIYDIDNLPTQPEVSELQAATIAKQDLIGDENYSDVFPPELMIYPVERDSSVQCHLAWKVKFNTGYSYEYFIDAIDGTILRKQKGWVEYNSDDK